MREVLIPFLICGGGEIGEALKQMTLMMNS